MAIKTQKVIKYFNSEYEEDKQNSETSCMRERDLRVKVVKVDKIIK